MICYVQPKGDTAKTAEHEMVCITRREAIDRQRSLRHYESDEAALADFRVVHWAWEVADSEPAKIVATSAEDEHLAEALNLALQRREEKRR